LSAANGAGPRNRFLKRPKGVPGLNYLCEGYKAFFTHVSEPMQLMAQLLRQGREAREVTGLLEQVKAAKAQQVPRVGRNAACPCGSGRKYKHCHGGS